jgi:hypothetical protein
MHYDKEGAIEWMKSRGYSNTATNGTEDLLFFLKKFPDGHIHLHATIFLKKQTIELDTTSVLDLGISLYCPAIQMDVMKFETFEERIYNYAYLCLYGKTNESGSKMGFALPNPSGQVHTGQSADESGTEGETLRGRKPGGVEKAEGKAKKPIKERKAAFWDEVKGVAKQKGYPKELAVEFYTYWTEDNKSGTRFRKEAETFFDIPKRFGTWIKNNKAWSKQTFVEQKAEKQNEELKTRKPTLKHKELF